MRLPRRMMTLEEYSQLMHCMDIVPDKMPVDKVLSLISRATPSLVVGGKIPLTRSESKCIGMYTSSTRDPVGMYSEGKGRIIPESVISFGSRESAVTWRTQRDLNEMSCCNMPMVDIVDVSNSRGVSSYLYKEPITQRIYMICNAGMVKMESCLLTSYIWKVTSSVCPPRVAELMLTKADSDKEMTFDKRKIKMHVFYIQIQEWMPTSLYQMGQYIILRIVL